MKILSRSWLVYNMLLFVVIAYFYLLLLSWPNLYHLNWSAILTTIINKVNGRLFFPFIVLNLILILFQYRISRVVLALYLVCINIYVNLLLINHFEKVVLLTNFVFLLVSYYVFEIWSFYLKFASFNPKLKDNHVINLKTFKIKVKLLLDNDIIDGFLVNYDSESCFILLNDEFTNIKEKYIKINFIIGSENFSVKMKIVSVNKQGVGFLGSLSTENYLWYDIYKLLNKRRILPFL